MATKRQAREDGGAGDGAGPVARSPWSVAAQEITAEMGVDLERGLSPGEADERRAKYGRNRLRETRRIRLLTILRGQFKSLVVLILVAAAVVSLIFARWLECVAIVVVILINTLIGFFTELKALRSMEALRKLSRTRATVRRDGRNREISSEELVPGDIVSVEAGDLVAADMRIIEASKLEANESALTGESSPVSKQDRAVDPDAPLAERSSMLYKGTVVSRGSGLAVVVAHGMDTELGRIASLVDEAEQTTTPLEARLEKLGRTLIWITLGVAAVTIGLGIWRGKDMLLMAETGVALGVAAIPEGLPIVATLALARGVRRMAKRNALVKRLSAVETLGSTGVILSDKTGTLTENQMTVTGYRLGSVSVGVEGLGLTAEGNFLRDGERVDPGEDVELRRAIEIGVLCNNASVHRSDIADEADGPDENDKREENEPGRDGRLEHVGDPMEVALLIVGRKAGIGRDALLERYPEEREVAFDPDTRAMATYHAEDIGYRVAVKGSPEAVLDKCTRVFSGDEAAELSKSDIADWTRTCDFLAAEGNRMLALAQKHVDSSDADPYEDLILAGIVCMHDPPRADVRSALKKCHDAGIRVIMVTGDQPGTALSVARSLGLVEDDEPDIVTGREMSSSDGGDLLDVRIFARMEPAQKLKLIEMHQKEGAVVAMTGDGINDAPALKKADIGVAMGLRGTDAAKEAADMVLQDDDFGTIVHAVEHGRTIFANIRKAIIFMLCTNVAEVIAVSVAAAMGWTLPLRPLQILYLNVLTDVFPALALSVGPGSGHEMEYPPRDPREPVLTRGHWTFICLAASVIGLCVLGNMLLAENRMGMDPASAITISFLTLGLSKLWFGFNLRDDRSGLINNEVVRNPWMWGAIGICIVLLVAAVYLPGLSQALETTGMGLAGWTMAVAASLVPLTLGQVWLLARNRRHGGRRRCQSPKG